MKDKCKQSIHLTSDEKSVETHSTTDDYTQMDSESEFLTSENEVVHVIKMENEPSCSFTQSSLAETSVDKNVGAMNTKKKNYLKWEGWTPNALKRPIAEVLQSPNAQEKEGNTWLKRRSPDQQSLDDQLIQEKINFVKSLIENSQEESKRRILILEEQLKREKMKTQKLLSNK